jgi:hypothetical protein
MVACACGRKMNKESVQCVKCRSVAAESNGAWKGGQTKSKAGYRMVRAVGHPRATAKSSYVFEHILVMEDALGRHLVPGETVHHRNGIKDDNRLENLELWIRPQPSGVRLEDAVEWARHIVRRYGHLFPEGTSGSSNNAPP